MNKIIDFNRQQEYFHLEKPSGIEIEMPKILTIDLLKVRAKRNGASARFDRVKIDYQDKFLDTV